MLSYDPFLLDRIRFDHEQRNHRVAAPGRPRRTSRATGARGFAHFGRRTAASPAGC